MWFGIVGVQELVVARGLVRVLCRDDAHVEGEILRAEQSFGEVDHVGRAGRAR